MLKRAIMKSLPTSTNPNGLVVLTELNELDWQGNEKPIIVALHLRLGEGDLDVVNVSSVYGRDLFRQIPSDLAKTVYWDKTKGYPFARRVGLQLPSLLTSEDNLSAANIKTEEHLSQPLYDKILLETALGKALAEKVTLKRGADEVGHKAVAEGYHVRGEDNVVINVDNIHPLKGKDGEQLLSRDERLQWVAFHELFHRGVSTNEGMKLFNRALKSAYGNPVVKELANKIAKAYQAQGVDISVQKATEEALAELRAAIDSRNLKALVARWDLQARASQSAVEKMYTQLRRVVEKILSKLTGRSVSLTDSEVIQLIRDISAQATQSAVKGESSAVAETSNGDSRYSLASEKEFDETAKKYGGEQAYQSAVENGKTELNYKQWVQVRTPAFKAWFGDWENSPETASKVVNKKTGEPLVVYHGTNNVEIKRTWNDKSRDYDSSYEKFTVFKRKNDGLRNQGLFFNNVEDNAGGYGSYLYSTFLSLKKPLIINANGRHFTEVNYKGEVKDTYEWAEYAEKKGYDGVIFENVIDGVDYSALQTQTNDYVAFKSSQIKSATDNTGDFDASNDDIRYSIRPINRPKAESIDKLRKAKSINISGEDIEPSTDLRQYKRNALNYGKNLRGSYVNKDTGQEIKLGRAAIQEVLRHDYKDPDHLQSIAAIPQIIEDAVYIDTLRNEDEIKNPHISRYDYYVAGLNIGGDDYTVKAVVSTGRDGEKYYDHKLTEIEKGELISLADRVSTAERTKENSPFDIDDKRLLQILQDDDTHYSLPADYQRDLMVTHNISEAGILHAAKMGGLPFASVAVTKNTQPLMGFGEVTLIGNRDYIDPNGQNRARVFGSDIYSPRYPNVYYEIKNRNPDTLMASLEQRAKEIDNPQSLYELHNLQKNDLGLTTRDIKTILKASPAVRYQFIKESRIPFEVTHFEHEESEFAQFPSVQAAMEKYASNPDEMLTDEQFLRQFVDELQAHYQAMARSENLIERRQAERRLKMVGNELERARTKSSGIAGQPLIRAYVEEAIESLDTTPRVDSYETEKAIADVIERHQDAFDDYVQGVTDNFEVNEWLAQGEDSDGARQFIPHTLENVIKSLQKDLRGGEDMNYGVPSIRARVTPQFKSILDIQENKHRLLDKASFDAAKEVVESEFVKLAKTMKVDINDLPTLLVNTIENGMKSAFEAGNVKPTKARAQAVADFLESLRQMPTEYFEGKAKDVTQFSDFVGAVIPNNLSSKARDVLSNAGLSIYEYKAGSQSSRAQVVKDAAEELDQREGDILFSLNESPNSEFTRAVDEIAGGKKVPDGNGKFINIGTTPDVLQLIGLPKLNVRINESVIEKVMGERLGVPKGKYKHLHNLTADDVKRLPAELNDPVAIFQSATRNKSVVVLTELQEHKTKNGKFSPIIAALHIKPAKKGVDIVDVRSFYGRSLSQIQAAFEDYTLYVNKAKGQQFLNTHNLQLGWDFTSDADLLAKDIMTEDDLRQYQSLQNGEVSYSINTPEDAVGATSEQEKQGWIKFAYSGKDTFIRRLQDRFRPIKQLQDAIAANGGKLNLDNNTYLAEERYHGQVENDLRFAVQR